MNGSTLPLAVAVDEVDVAVVGAGPAGSSAAIELSRAGRQVLLIDSRTFPRDKPCGGCLSGPTTTRLKLLLGHATRLPGTAGTRVTVVVDRSRVDCHPRGCTRIVQRSELDNLLANCAAASGAELRFGEAAALARGSQGWEIEVGGARIRPRTVLLACGAGGLAGRLGLAARRPGRAARTLQWVQPVSYDTPAAGGIEVHWLRRGRVLLAAPHEDLCTVAVTTEIPAPDSATLWQRLRQLNPGAALWKLLPEDALQRYAAQAGAVLPWRPLVYGESNLLLVGDAAGCLAAFPGEGIGLALTSAACARQAILLGEPVLGRYAELMRRFHQPLARRSAWIARLMRAQALQTIASRGARLAPRRLRGVLERVYVGTA